METKNKAKEEMSQLWKDLTIFFLNQGLQPIAFHKKKMIGSKNQIIPKKISVKMKRNKRDEMKNIKRV